MKKSITALLTLFLLTINMTPAYSEFSESPSDVVQTAINLKGSNSDGFTTFGFVRYVFEQAEGIVLPNNAERQWELGQSIERDDLQAGDVLFFQGNYLMPAIHIGQESFIIVTTSGIEERNLAISSYWNQRYIGAKRFDELEEVANPLAKYALEQVGENSHEFTTAQFVHHAFHESLQLSIPDTALGQWGIGETVEKEELQPGDVVFFQGNYFMSGIYTGFDSVVMVTTSGITEVSLASSYWSSRYIGAKRINKNTIKESMKHENPIVEKAASLVGTAYTQNGKTPETGFNTGGYIHYVFKEVTGSLLSRNPSRQYEAGQEISRSELEPGDLVFFNGTTSSLLSGIYKGDGFFYIVTSSGVAERNLEFDSYWSSRYAGAARYTDEILSLANPKTYMNHEHKVIQEAMKYIHTPYLLMGDTLAGFDCSYLIQTIFREGMEIYLPRATYTQWQVGEVVLPEGSTIKGIDLDEHIKPGDAIYFSDTWKPGISHVGVYLGNNYMVHASGEEGETTISYISEYWQDKYTGVKRFDELSLRLDIPVIEEASKHIGVQYTKNGTSPSTGFDTAGFIQYVFSESENIQLPRYANQQWAVGTEVARRDLSLGDVIFFEGSSTLIPGIFIGNEQVILVTQTDGVRIIDLKTSSYWSSRFHSARQYKSTATNHLSDLAKTYLSQPYDDTTAAFVKQIVEEATTEEFPSTVTSQWDKGMSIEVENLEPGDLVFFTNGQSDAPWMSGIYTGLGNFIIVIDSTIQERNLIYSDYWKGRYLGAKRL
ncbi:bifunctional murein DD-endopeptidase/murein LD-carboxypeptidase [bacterium LRH843]|nr:bifunctional murein DD-endopeptidase/murein LD-carboxypeptidase [bacterium LRH843]